MIQLPSKIYDILKWTCLIGMPAVATLLTTLNSLWGWGLPIEAIVGTITAVDTFIGILLGVSTMNYNKEANE